jgi:hypothetical protein
MLEVKINDKKSSSFAGGGLDTAFIFYALFL